MNSYNFRSPWVTKTNIDWSALKRLATQRFYAKNNIIYTQNTVNPVYYIESGRVRISIFNEQGVEKTLGVVHENNIFGEFPGIDGQANFATATTITDCWLFVIPRDKFIETVQQDIDLNEKVMKNLCRKIRILTAQVQELTFLGSTARVAQALYNLTLDHGLSENKGWRIALKFTHQEMADLVGTCRVTVSKVFRELTEQGILDKKDGFYLITDPEALKRIAHY